MRYQESPSAPVLPLGETLPLERISPRPTLQATQDAASLAMLTESIQRFGLLRPVTVRSSGPGRYVIISGNRRLTACRMLGWACIQAHILRRDTAWQPPERLMEALETHRLHYLEAAGILRVLHHQHRMSWATLAQQLHADPRQLETQANLAALEDDIQALLLEEGAPMYVAELLLRLPAGSRRAQTAQAITRERLCPRDAALMISAELRRDKGIFQDRTNRVYKSDIPSEPEAPPRRVIRVIRDRRLYLNALRDIAGQMQEAGFAATVAERRMPGQMEMVIRIPTRQRRMERYQSM